MNRLQPFATGGLRLVTAANFISAISPRLGLWPGGSWPRFLGYAAQVLSFAPPWAVPALALAATAAEVALAVALLAGWHVRWAAYGAAGLTLCFALAMAWSFGPREPFDYSVFVDSASAFLLGTLPPDPWSLDARRRRPAAFGNTSGG